jgi:hypothetical protein
VSSEGQTSPIVSTPISIFHSCHIQFPARSIASPILQGRIGQKRTKFQWFHYEWKGTCHRPSLANAPPSVCSVFAPDSNPLCGWLPLASCIVPGCCTWLAVATLVPSQRCSTVPSSPALSLLTSCFRRTGHIPEYLPLPPSLIFLTLLCCLYLRSASDGSRRP